MKKKCLYCNSEFETHTTTLCCCKEHLRKFRNKQQYPDGSDYVECKICQHRGQNLHAHIRKFHKITTEQYCMQFNINEIELQTVSLRRHNSEMQKKAVAEGRLHGWPTGDKNPSRSKDAREGRRSIFSINYRGYDGLSDIEKRQKIDSVFQWLADQKKINNNNPLTVDYYIKRGATEKEAKTLLHNRQSTFSLQKCIDRFGEEDGKQIFEARQKKWQNTLNSKPLEEIERISKAKFRNGRGRSKISQKLFDRIHELIRDSYSEVFYATSDISKEFNEFMVVDSKTGKKYFLDFYVKDNNKVIEFDGDYWHREKSGNQERDRIREEHLRELGFTNIFRVKERDYLKDPDKVVIECVEFINK